jgi:hypothetical protein
MTALARRTSAGGSQEDWDDFFEGARSDDMGGPD